MGIGRPLPQRPLWRRAPIGSVGVILFALTLGACDPATAPFSGERCEGVPFDACQSAIDEAAAAAAGRGAIIVGVRVRCTSAACTPQQGEIAVQAWFSDGSEYESSSGYATPVGPPPGGPVGGPTPIPLEPICLSMPRAWCLEQAAAALGSGPGAGATPVSVVVTCTTPPCTETAGGGKAVVTYDDGTQSEMGFEYDGEIPVTIPVASPSPGGPSASSPASSP